AGEVAVARVLEDGAAGHLAEALAVEPIAVDQAVESGGQHVLVGGVRVGAVGAREGDPVAADDGDPVGLLDQVRLPFDRCFAEFSGGRSPRRPGSIVATSSSAVSSADIAGLRSHQWASASAAPSTAAE